MSAVLQVQDLAVEFKTLGGVVHAVNGVTFEVRRGETVAIVGESGSGKSVTALAVMGLISKPGRIAAGDVRFQGRSLVGLPERDYRALRGNDIAMIFQDPLLSLNPAFRVGAQIAEAVRAHSEVSRDVAWKRAEDLLGLVGIPSPSERVRAYPHELSGGMRQRVMIAMAIANDPTLLIADEPTTALDVTIQAQVLDVLKAAQHETDAALLLITHDLGIVAGLADRVVVMYAGRVVEEGSLDQIFYEPRHPYTIGLLESLPRLDADRHAELQAIPGTPPSMLEVSPGCDLAPRCSFAVDECRSARPPLAAVDDGEHLSACFRADELDELRERRGP